MSAIRDDLSVFAVGPKRGCNAEVLDALDDNGVSDDLLAQWMLQEVMGKYSTTTLPLG